MGSVTEDFMSALVASRDGRGSRSAMVFGEINQISECGGPTPGLRIREGAAEITK
jgi:hypothetical protein